MCALADQADATFAMCVSVVPDILCLVRLCLVIALIGFNA